MTRPIASASTIALVAVLSVATASDALADPGKKKRRRVAERPHAHDVVDVERHRGHRHRKRRLTRMPDLYGLSLREALYVLETRGLYAEIHRIDRYRGYRAQRRGRLVVVDQAVRPGRKLRRGSVIHIDVRPKRRVRHRVGHTWYQPGGVRYR